MGVAGWTVGYVTGTRALCSSGGGQNTLHHPPSQHTHTKGDKTMQTHRDTHTHTHTHTHTDRHTHTHTHTHPHTHTHTDTHTHTQSYFHHLISTSQTGQSDRAPQQPSPLPLSPGKSSRQL